MQELLEKFSSLLREYSELKSDYLSERDNRRTYQSRVEEAQRAMSEHDRQQVGLQRIALYLLHSNIVTTINYYMSTADNTFIQSHLATLSQRYAAQVEADTSL